MLLLGSFYILEDTIYFNKIGDGLDHPVFWKKIVLHFFEDLVYETKLELCESVYGTDRGRLTYFEGRYQLLGTPNCKKHEKVLKRIFGLTNKTPHIVDWINDGHYKIQAVDAQMLEHCLQLSNIKKIGKIAEYKKEGFVRYD